MLNVIQRTKDQLLLGCLGFPSNITGQKGAHGSPWMGCLIVEEGSKLRDEEGHLSFHLSSEILGPNGLGVAGSFRFHTPRAPDGETQ